MTTTECTTTTEMKNSRQAHHISGFIQCGRGFSELSAPEKMVNFS